MDYSYTHCEHIYICNNEKNILFCQKCGNIIHINQDKHGKHEEYKGEISKESKFKSHHYKTTNNQQSPKDLSQKSLIKSSIVDKSSPRQGALEKKPSFNDKIEHISIFNEESKDSKDRKESNFNNERNVNIVNKYSNSNTLNKKIKETYNKTISKTNSKNDSKNESKNNSKSNSKSNSPTQSPKSEKRSQSPEPIKKIEKRLSVFSNKLNEESKNNYRDTYFDINIQDYSYTEDFTISKIDNNSNDRINIEVKDLEEQITYIFEVYSGITLYTVQKLLQKYIKISFSEKELCYRYKSNSKKEYYEDYSIFLLFSRKKERKYFQYVINFHETDDDHKCLVLAVKKENKIIDLKQVIALEKQMIIDNFVLCNLHKKLLDNDQVFLSEQELFVYNLKRTERITDIPIFIQNFYGELFQINISKDSKVIDLKKKFSGGDYFEIVHKRTNKLLENNQIMSSLISENDLFYIISSSEKKPQPLRIYTRNLDEINSEIYIYNDTLILTGKRIIELVEGIHFEKQKLKYKGKVMEDEKCFQDYNIIHDSIIYLEDKK